MNNFIEYFYGIKIKKIIYKENYYSFIYNGYTYKLYSYDDTYERIKSIYDTNKNLIGNTLMSEIIVNRNNDIISNYNGINYILIKLFININKSITLDEISILSKSMSKEKINSNWGILWSNKIDYLEDLINENGKRYPLIVDSFNYFAPMCENAISYFNSVTIDSDYKYVVSHRIIKFDDSIEVLYNPMNIIFDFKVRDVAEYLKNAFFNKNQNIYNELINYLNKNQLSLMEVKLLISRLLYPSFYFEMYEDILINEKEEKILINIISRLDDYEKYLSDIISFFKKYYDIDEINWLNKFEN